ncbi:MAG: S-layer homology domain-containing protein [Clostridia bacterium]|nr:S-layer homology domain-containing protein [Clostridia bacterium]
MKKQITWLRKTAALLIALLTFASALTGVSFTASAETPAFASAEEWSVLKLTNDERNKEELTPLTTFSALDAAAKVRADETVTLFSHARPDGTACFTALDGIEHYSAGENIAAGYGSPESVVVGWMNSEGHRKNILTDGFKHLGVGYAYKSGDTYGTYWTQLFIGGCRTTGFSIAGAEKGLFVPVGSKLEDMGLVLAVTCDLHGTTYMPLECAKCSYDSSKSGPSSITVTFDGITADLPATFGFSDVPAGKWFEKPVMYVVGKGYFSGTSASTFSPGMQMSRAMFVTVLSKVAGADLSGYASGPFRDIPAGKYYLKAANWAFANGIVSGTAEGVFSPNASITRQEVCLMIQKYLRYKGVTCRENETSGLFADDAKIAKWARSAVYTMRGIGIISGKPGNLADPKGTATRAEVATMIKKLDEAQAEAFNLTIDKVDIKIDGAKDSLRMLQMSDMHLTLTDASDSAEAVADQSKRGAMFDAEIKDGVSRKTRFEQFLGYYDCAGADLLAMTGDIIDAPSNGNISFLRDQLAGKGREYLFVLGNHDWTGNWIGDYQSDYQRSSNIPKFADIIGEGEDGIAVRAYDGFTVIAVDNSNDQVTSEQYAAVNKLIKDKTPFILLLHVPVDSACSPSLASDTAAKWGRTITMGNSATNPTQLTTKFVELLQSEKSTCKAIICGHIHMDHVDRISESNGTVQYCLGASYEGYGRLFNIHG